MNCKNPIQKGTFTPYPTKKASKVYDLVKAYRKESEDVQREAFQAIYKALNPKVKQATLDTQWHRIWVHNTTVY